MPIKPIDMQSNIGQMHEVARGTHTRTEAVVEQQHILDVESDEKSRLVKTKLEENKKAEKTIILKEEKKNPRGEHRGGRREKGTPEKEESQETVEGIGRIIDVKK